MKILIDISPLVVEKLTGIGNYVYSLTKEVLTQDSKNEYYLFCFSPFNKVRDMKNHPFGSYKSVQDITVLPLPSKLAIKFYKLWQRVNFPHQEVFLKQKIEVVHNHEWYTPPLKASAKLVSTVFDLTVINQSQWHKESNIKLQTERLKRLSRADKIITISNSARSDLIEYMPSLVNKINIIYPGVNEKLGRISDSKRKDLIKKLKFKRPFILTVGTIEPRKNIEGLIKAFLNVSGQIEDDLVIVGNDGWKSENFLSLVESSDRIKYLKYISSEDLSELYNLCHFFAYPSFYEGFGLPVLEALSSGKKVLTSNTSSLPEVLGKEGFLCDPYNSTSIELGLLEMAKECKNGVIYNDSITQAAKFSYKASAEKLIQIYNSLD